MTGTFWKAETLPETNSNNAVVEIETMAKNGIS
jgi:hypothetical protein